MEPTNPFKLEENEWLSPLNPLPTKRIEYIRIIKQK
jgi:hypothetical protein